LLIGGEKAVGTLNPRGQFVCVKLATARAWHKPKVVKSVVVKTTVVKTVAAPKPTPVASLPFTG
jgi:hypothetical protein